MFQSVTGYNGITLQDAAEQNRLFVCDYVQFEDAEGGVVHGERRYLPAPIALFYWNPTPPKGFPPGKGALQPIAIQLGQAFDEESTPIFTPNNCSNADDANGLKWKIAKYIVNSICTVQHESVAHLGACHLTVEPVVVASHRRLPKEHPLMKLLLPHFRFTIEINDSALHSLIVPGGVVATVIGPTIESTGQLLAKASAAWRWDEHNPDHLFNLRGVDSDALSDFPFRDDTLLLWNAIKNFVGNYVETYYPNDQSVADDYEVQGWINELVSPLYAGFKGLNGLKATGNAGAPFRIDSRDYLVELVSHIIYIAGPQHASVNYAQFPLMTYSPAVSGTIYHAPPKKSTVIDSVEDCMKWYPPLDIALYIVSFGYLLSGIQFDTFGQYSSNPRIPYFTDPKISEFALDFQEELAEIEKTIRQRNRSRPMPYQCQLPSMIPNSISI
jgi:arachidonate 15-lipoxygenase